jgi:hypothetical protein
MCRTDVEVRNTAIQVEAGLVKRDDAAVEIHIAAGDVGYVVHELRPRVGGAQLKGRAETLIESHLQRLVV